MSDITPPNYGCQPPDHETTQRPNLRIALTSNVESTVELMGRWDERYSKETKNLVGRAVVDGLDGSGTNVSATRVQRALQAGDHPFHEVAQAERGMSLSMVRHLGKKERRARLGFNMTPAARLEPNEAKEQLRKRIVSLIEGQLDHIAQHPGDITLDDGIKLVRLHRELDALGNGQEPRKNRARPTDQTKPAVKDTSDTVRRLVQEHHAQELGHTDSASHAPVRAA